MAKRRLVGADTIAADFTALEWESNPTLVVAHRLRAGATDQNQVD